MKGKTLCKAINRKRIRAIPGRGKVLEVSFHESHPNAAEDQIFTLRNLRLLLTTNTLLKAIAPAASIGTRNPNAAAGISTIL
jgi:hypothetical protein